MLKTRTNPARFRIKAFSLLESLIVLGLVLISLEIFALGIKQGLEQARVQVFLIRFEGLYKSTQQRAGLLRQRQELSVESGWLTSSTGRIRLPEELSIKPFRLVFNERGGNSSLKKIEMEWGHEKRKITYQLGIGNGNIKRKKD
ncbi:competence type IV pilus minor pilin ComGD [Lactococcus termiticola]|nr:competence type IV pilus minor pilin ComGD [Lactococcus termiticola]